MNKKVAITTVIVIFVAIIAIIFYESVISDNEGPKIVIGEVQEITYTEGEDKSILLQNVTAVDDRDGDVTASLIVSRITNEGYVYYAAGDKSGNVTESKDSRKINYIRKENSSNESETKEKESETTTSVSDDTSENESESTTEEQTTAPADGIPVIKLVASEKTINVGEAFNPLSAVEYTKDDSGDVSRRIRADGSFDTTKPGDYIIKYSVTDYDGNQSEIVPFTLHVVEKESAASEENTDKNNEE